MSRWHADPPATAGKSWERTPEGYLIFRQVRLTRCGVLPYEDASRPGGVRREYRPVEEVMLPESLASLEGRPIVWSHPIIWGHSGEQKIAITAENHAEYSVGHVQNVRAHDDGWPRGDCYLTHAGAVSAVLEGLAVELSPGYWNDDDETPGVSPEGEPYDLVQRNIRYNHLAIVEEARAGSAARLVLDAADTPKETGMTLEELKAALEKALEEKKATDEQVAELQKQLEAVVGELDALRAGADLSAAEAAQGDVEPVGDSEDIMLDEDDVEMPAAPKTMNMDSADFRAGAAHYTRLMACAAHYKIDGADKLPVAQLRRKIVAAHMGAAFKADASDGYYTSAVDLIASRLHSANESRDALARAKVGQIKGDSAPGKQLTHEDYAANRKAATRKA